MIFKTASRRLIPSFAITGLSVAIVAMALVLAAPGPASAAVVSSITVEGNQQIDAATVEAYLTIQPNRNFSSADVDESLRALFDTGLFSDVQIKQRGGTLVVSVAENPIINEIAFEGNKKFKDDQLSTIVTSKPRGVFTRSKVQVDVQRILENYRRAGRYQASVTPQTIALPNNRVNLVFELSEGPNTNVSGITFIGNQAYGDRRLRGVISTRESGYFGFLRSTDVYDPDRLTNDQEKLRNYYLDRGYADLQLVSSVADLDRERNTFFITFTINEGQRYRFGAVNVDSSIPGTDPAALQDTVTTDEGDWYSNREIQRSTERLTLRLAESGFPFAQVQPRLARDPATQTVGITYVIDEGSRSYVERIDVRGNARTRDYVIRREFDIAEGDAYNRVLIDRAKRRLTNLGYFSDVRISTEPGSSEDRVVVAVDVVEQSTGELSFGAGYSSGDGIVGDVSLTERNFLGRGYNVRVAAGGGSNSRNYEFGFTDPYFLGRRISAGFNVFRREYDESNYRSYDYTSTGGGLSLGFPITEDFTVQLGYQLEYKEIDAPDFDEGDPLETCPGGVSRAICQAEGETLTSSVLYSLIYDSLDSRLNPRNGIYAKFTQEFAGVGGDVSYLRSTGTASYYRPILADQDVIGFVKVQGGHIMGIGEDVRLLDSFFKGGETVRGFRSSGFGPRDLETDDALGGNVFAAATAEVQFPLPFIPPEVGFKGAFFADAGTLFDTDIDEDDFPAGTVDIVDEASLRSSVGGSILWASPLGPLRADFAYVLSSEDYDRDQVFRIGGGAKF